MFIEEIANFVDAFTEKGNPRKVAIHSLSIHIDGVALQGSTFFCLIYMLDMYLGKAFFEIIYSIIHREMFTEEGSFLC